MGAETGIEWAHSTVNVWEGCAKISPACKHCYAETNSPVRAMEARIGEVLGVEPDASGKRRLKMWGVDGFRYETANWEEQLRALNRKAAAFRAGYQAGGGERYIRPRVFVNSLSDTFEDWQGPVYRLEDGKPVVVAQSLDDVRARFFRVAEECTELDLLLLTKRPENVLRMVPKHWKHLPECPCNDCVGRIRRAGWPSHIWIGTTVEDQKHADRRIPELLKVPARVRFLSVEPLLGEVDLPWLHNCTIVPGQGETLADQVRSTRKLSVLHWVIVGGESGSSARPMHPDWVRYIRDQCKAAGVPFFFKQWGGWTPDTPNRYRLENVALWNCKDADGWIYLRDLQPDRRENWDEHQVGDVRMYKVGKKNAGRVLDGELWSEVPGESF